MQESTKNLAPSEEQPPTKPAESSSGRTGLIILGVVAVLLLIVWMSGGFDGSGSPGVSGDGCCGSGETGDCSNSNKTGKCSTGICAANSVGNYECLLACTGGTVCPSGKICLGNVCTIPPCGSGAPNGLCSGTSNVCIPTDVTATNYKCGTQCTSSSCSAGQSCVKFSSSNTSICATACVSGTCSTGYTCSSNKVCVPDLNATLVMAQQYSVFDMVGSNSNYTPFIKMTYDQFMAVSNEVNLVFFSAVTASPQSPINLTINLTVRSISGSQPTLYYGNEAIQKIPMVPGNYGPFKYRVVDAGKAFVVMSQDKSKITGSLTFSKS